MQKILTEGKVFRNADGRQMIFNGLNLSNKGHTNSDKTGKDYDVNWDEDLIIALKQKGVNLIRLGMTWDAVEPRPGEYNEEYLDSVQKITDLCEKHGIYFYLDMHQDLYGGACDTPADGAPMWACMTDGYKFHQTKFVWAEGYFFGKAIQHCFDHFWRNDKCCGKAIQECYSDMWVHVAERFKDNTALFGFDIMNEPFPGTTGGLVFLKLVASAVKYGCFDKRVDRLQLVKDALKPETRHKVLDQFADPKLFHSVVCDAGAKIIRNFDVKYYYPMICRVAKAIRSVTDNGIIMMENCYYSNLGIPCSTPAVTIDGRREKQLCFAPHGYDLMVDTPDYKYASNSRTGSIFDEHKCTQERLDVPVIVGEWGGSGGNEGTEWLNHINFLLDKFDENQWGQTYWCYGDDMFDSVIMQSLLRIAPRAVTGTIDYYRTDRDNRIFELKYSQDKHFDSPTEIYVPFKINSIETDGKYNVNNIEGTDASIIEIYTEPGDNIVVIKY